MYSENNYEEYLWDLSAEMKKIQIDAVGPLLEGRGCGFAPLEFSRFSQRNEWPTFILFY